MKRAIDMEVPRTRVFLVVDHLGRIAGCHSHNFAGSIFDLPKSGITGIQAVA
jgi:hypothetical protein